VLHDLALLLVHPLHGLDLLRGLGVPRVHLGGLRLDAAH